MRIVSGEFKGRRFSPPKSFKARPTTDFAKENLFNVLNNHLSFEDLKVLDLFSGTGSISYEFASRGTKDITLLEKNFNHFKFISKCIAELGLENSIFPLRGDSFKYLAKCTQQYDLIFADPPYKLERVTELPDTVINNNLLKPGGIFILEHSQEHSFARHNNFYLIKKYGSVHFSFFK